MRLANAIVYTCCCGDDGWWSSSSSSMAAHTTWTTAINSSIDETRYSAVARRTDFDSRPVLCHCFRRRYTVEWSRARRLLSTRQTMTSRLQCEVAQQPPTLAALWWRRVTHVKRYRQTHQKLESWRHQHLHIITQTSSSSSSSSSSWSSYSLESYRSPVTKWACIPEVNKPCLPVLYALFMALPFYRSRIFCSCILASVFLVISIITPNQCFYTYNFISPSYGCTK